MNDLQSLPLWLFFLLWSLGFPTVGLAQMIVAHRGASSDAPENTLAAVAEAWRQGADGVEGDFRLTSDNQIVCIHDDDTLRTGGQKLLVNQNTLATLRSIEYGRWKAPRFAGEPLATFAQWAGQSPDDRTLVIEIKSGPELVPLLQSEIERLHLRRDRLWIIAFDSTVVAKAKELLPDVRAHWLTGYRRDRSTGRWSPTAAEVLKALKSCGADGLGTQNNRQVVTEDFLDKLKDGGMKEFHVWTVDDADDMRYYQDLGALGITTNRPGFAKSILSR